MSVKKEKSFEENITRLEEIVSLLEGNTCGPRKTSCADQLTLALREAQAQARS